MKRVLLRRDDVEHGRLRDIVAVVEQLDQQVRRCSCGELASAQLTPRDGALVAVGEARARTAESVLLSTSGVRMSTNTAVSFLSADGERVDDLAGWPPARAWRASRAPSASPGAAGRPRPDLGDQALGSAGPRRNSSSRLGIRLLSRSSWLRDTNAGIRGPLECRRRSARR